MIFISEDNIIMLGGICTRTKRALDQVPCAQLGHSITKLNLEAKTMLLHSGQQGFPVAEYISLVRGRGNDISRVWVCWRILIYM